MRLVMKQRLTLFLLLISGCIGSMNLWAAESEALEAVKEGIFTPGYLAQLFAGLLLVVGLIFILAALFKRFGEPVMSNQPMRVLGGVSVGQRERLVLVQVGSEQIVLGVAPGHVSRVHQLESPIVELDSLSQGQSTGLGRLFGRTPNSEIQS